MRQAKENSKHSTDPSLMPVSSTKHSNLNKENTSLVDI
jgi:hypothetical protein